jgi:hypothetical protein
MNRLEAEKALKESDVNMRYVSLYGELRDECIILEMTLRANHSSGRATPL